MVTANVKKTSTDINKIRSRAAYTIKATNPGFT